jgi:hypothetical protein
MGAERYRRPNCGATDLVSIQLASIYDELLEVPQLQAVVPGEVRAG